MTHGVLNRFFQQVFVQLATKTCFHAPPSACLFSSFLGHFSPQHFSPQHFSLRQFSPQQFFQNTLLPHFSTTVLPRLHHSQHFSTALLCKLWTSLFPVFLNTFLRQVTYSRQVSFFNTFLQHVSWTRFCITNISSTGCAPCLRHQCPGTAPATKNASSTFVWILLNTWPKHF